MQPEEIIAKIVEVVPDAEIEVSGEDCSFKVQVISPAFQGVRPVMRQQRVLQPFSACLSSGELHALTVQAYTPQEWGQQNQNHLVTLGG